ncbi:putative peptidase [Burkholderiales bacterium GJ-E10]|nr:putative peptidase [Burkholderiales bacterium GJ-E10]
MQIIFVDRRLSRARTVHLTRTGFFAAFAGFGFLVFATTAVIFAVTVRLAVTGHIPYVRNLVAFMAHDQIQRDEMTAQTKVSAMAKMVGTMQAQLLRLDALGERVSKLAGINPETFRFGDLPGEGGPLDPGARQVSIGELQQQVASVDKQVEQRADYLRVVESELVANQASDALLPHGTPVRTGYIGSGYGERLDPFTGRWSLHPGIDFDAPKGTPILAAAGGVVVRAQRTPDYGNMVEIDHGNGLSTLYGHASRLDVKVGDIVRKGQEIAEVGSTGRSTGPHLHFEVRVHEVPQNPTRYLAALQHGFRGKGRRWVRAKVVPPAEAVSVQ